MLRILISSLLFLCLQACSNGNGNGGGNVAEPANAAPLISAIPDQSIEANTEMQAIAFSISDDTTAASNLGLTVVSDNEALVAPEGLVIEGTGAERTLLVTPAPNQIGSTLITIQVSDEKNLQTEESFELTVVQAVTSFEEFVREVFAAGPNDEPVPINALEFIQDATDFDDLIP